MHASESTADSRRRAAFRSLIFPPQGKTWTELPSPLTNCFTARVCAESIAASTRSSTRPARLSSPPLPLPPRKVWSFQRLGSMEGEAGAGEYLLCQRTPRTGLRVRTRAPPVRADRVEDTFQCGLLSSVLGQPCFSTRLKRRKGACAFVFHARAALRTAGENPVARGPRGRVHPSRRRRG